MCVCVFWFVSLAEMGAIRRNQRQALFPVYSVFVVKALSQETTQTPPADKKGAVEGLRITRGENRFEVTMVYFCRS